MSTANDFFSSLLNQAREKDRTVPKSRAAKSQQQSTIPASTSANAFFSSLEQEAEERDFLSSRAGFVGSGVGGGGQAGGGGGRKETPAPETLGERISNLGTALSGAVLSGADNLATFITSFATVSFPILIFNAKIFCM